jgi:FkbM family methyltransferase
MDFIEKFKLRYRANKYKKKNDVGGIVYLFDSIKVGQTALDIGAHKGGYLYFMQKLVGQNGSVIAFEPQTNLFQYIKKIKSIFNWDHVSVEHLAISDGAGEATLYIPGNVTGDSSSPGASIAKAMDEISSTEKVKTESLDAYCKSNNIKPDFIKIDVEGNELKIFKGGVETLKNHKPKVIVEIEARHVGEEQVMETIQFLLNVGYSGFFIRGTSRIPVSEFRFDINQNINDMANYCNNFVFE